VTLLELGEGELVSQSKRQPRMLQHVIKAQVLNLVFGGVDMVV
jgi:hypothetical protein